MITVMIEDNNIQAKIFVEFIRTLPFAAVIETQEKCFEEACAECNGRPASEFFDELLHQVKKHFNNA